MSFLVGGGNAVPALRAKIMNQRKEETIMYKLKPIKDASLTRYFVDITQEVHDQFASDLRHIPTGHPWQMAIDDLVMGHAISRIKYVQNRPILNQDIVAFVNKYYDPDDNNYHIYAITDEGYVFLRRFARALYSDIRHVFKDIMLFPSKKGAYKGAFVATDDLIKEQNSLQRMRLLYRTFFVGQAQNLKMFNILNHCFINSNAVRMFENLSIGLNEVKEFKEPLGVYIDHKVKNAEIADKKSAIIDVADYVFDTFDYQLNKIDDTPHLRIKAKDTTNNYLRRFVAVHGELPHWCK